MQHLVRKTVQKRTKLVTRFVPILVLLVSCGGGDSPSAPDVPNITGTWQFTETYGNTALGLSCNNGGSLNLIQSSGNVTGIFTQEGMCIDSNLNIFDNSGSGSVSGGQISGTNLSFVAGGCTYNGSVSGNPANLVSGSIICALAIGGMNFDLTGSWTASR